MQRCGRNPCRADPQLVRTAKPPVPLDEWQRVPQVWNVARRAVDDGCPPGSFVLTGSAVPPVGEPLHSGAGRLVSLRMRPMGLSERGLVQPCVSLASLLEGSAGAISGQSPLRLAEYVAEIERSGLPGVRNLGSRARRLQLDSYLTRIITRDLGEQGITLRRPQSLRAWMEAYAAATCTTASYNEIQRAAHPGDADPPTEVTTITYRDWLTQLWILDPLPAWTRRLRPLRELGQAPKHQLADPALAARLLRVTSGLLLSGGRSTRGADL